jgi:prefoldin subunit 5
MSNENSGNGGKIIIGALAVALIGSWIYFSTSKTEIISNYTTQVNKLDSAKNVLQADFIAVSAKADSLTQQNTALQGDLLSKSKDIQQLKSNISTILQKKNATDKELVEAKSMIAE